MTVTSPRQRFAPTADFGGPRVPATLTRHNLRAPSYLTFNLLQYMFIALPLLMGLDKFANVMTDWPHYLAPWIERISPMNAQGTLYVVGAIEIAVGIFMIVKPRYTALVTAAWLSLIIVNLLTYPGFYDVVLRDAVLLLAVIALARLGRVYDPSSQTLLRDNTSQHH